MDERDTYRIWIEYTEDNEPVVPVVDMVRTGENLKYLMKTNGISVSRLQEYLSLCCPQSVYKWLRGQALPRIEYMLAMSRLFHVSVEGLLCIRNCTYAVTFCENMKMNESSLQLRLAEYAAALPVGS